MILTRDKGYKCALVGRSGLMNSALFCEELVSKMLEIYRGRFIVYENTPVQKIILSTEALIDLDIDGVEGPLDYAIESVLGYVDGYLHKKETRPIATVYFNSGQSDRPSGYFYLSRRNYPDGSNRSLTCMVGPNQSLNKGESHNPQEVQDEHEYARIDEFYRKSIVDASEDARRDFSWNGLMGYTSDGIRLIGPDAANASLIYNLGCNGIGILPSIYGGKRIARYCMGEQMEPSIFDPRSF